MLMPIAELVLHRLLSHDLGIDFYRRMLQKMLMESDMRNIKEKANSPEDFKPYPRFLGKWRDRALAIHTVFYLHMALKYFQVI